MYNLSLAISIHGETITMVKAINLSIISKSFTSSPLFIQIHFCFVVGALNIRPSLLAYSKCWIGIPMLHSRSLEFTHPASRKLGAFRPAPSRLPFSCPWLSQFCSGSMGETIVDYSEAWDHAGLFICARLIVLSVAPSMLLHVAGFLSFQRLNKIPLHAYITFSLSICPLMEI